MVFYQNLQWMEVTLLGDDKLLKEIGMRVSARRKEMHLTQEQIAEKMDVSVQMVSNLELGRKAIRPENLVKICAILGVSADYILTGNHSDKELLELSHKVAKLSSKHQWIIEQLVDSLIDNDK